jgi:hypothetical protein
LDETTGTVAADSTGHGWNGSLVNGVTWSSGKVNNAASFTGSSNQYVTLPSGILKEVTDCTIAAWVKVNSTTANMRIFDFGTSTAPGASAGVYMFLTPNNGNGQVRWATTTAGYNNEKSIAVSYALPTGTWTHVAVTLSGTTGTLYVNGVASGTNTAMTLNPASLGNTTQNYIGKSQYSADKYLDGAVDEFQIFGRALSATEIAALAAPTSAPSGVVATSGSNASIAVRWNALSGASGYNVLRSLASGSGYSIAASSLSGTSYADTGLANGTRYYYQVTALNGLAESSTSAEVSAIADGTPPVITVPSNITVNASGSNGAVVTFSTSGTDAISGPCATTNLPSSGSVFPIGTTTVTATAVDTSGNAGSASFTVTVQTLPISSNEQQCSTPLALSGGTGLLLFAAPVPGHSYQLQFCDDLASGAWQNYGAPQLGDSSTLQFNLPVSASQPRRFYRIEIKK